jgi:sugar/nucleoside kinase (ribokinase family)
MNKTYDVVIAGEVFCDLIFTGLPRLPEPGEELYSIGFDMVPGGIYTTAVTLRRLGLEVGMFTRLGNDPFSRYLLESMQAEDIDLSLVQRLDHPLRTLTVAASFEHDRSFISFADARPPGPTPAQAVQGHPFRHVHIHSLGQLWDAPELVERARMQGAGVSLDCQCCPDVMVRPDVQEKIGLADVFMPNQREAQLLTNTDNPEDALWKLAEWVPTAIVKMGKQGSIAVHEGLHYTFPALQVDVVDTTGAGDAFAGGFMYGLLTGLPFEECVRVASVCGALSTTARGGASRVPRNAELDGWLTRLDPAGTNKR